MKMYGDSRSRMIEVGKYCIACILLPFIFLYACKPEETKLNPTQVSDWSKLGPGGGGSTFLPTFSYHAKEEFLVRCDMTGSYLTNDGGDSYSQINFANG